MIRIFGAGIVLDVAADAIRRRALVLPAYVALSALQLGVCSYQGKAGKTQVVKLCAQPGIHAVVALLALRGEIQRHVAGPGGLLELVQVTAHAISRKPLETPHRSARVAGITFEGSMRSNQWKAVLVLLDLVDRHAPSVHRVALLAGRPELAPVDVGVAVGAFRTDVGEDEVGMTLAARNLLVQAAQGVLGLVVIKFRDVADRLPARKCMAILARDGQVAVGAARRHGGAAALISPNLG